MTTTEDIRGLTTFLALALGAMLLLSTEIIRLGRTPTHALTSISPPPWSAPFAPSPPGSR